VKAYTLIVASGVTDGLEILLLRKFYHSMKLQNKSFTKLFFTPNSRHKNKFVID